MSDKPRPKITYLVPLRCPVCNGTGHVPDGFYTQNLEGVWCGTSAGNYEPCRSCLRGVVFQQSEPQL